MLAPKRVMIWDKNESYNVDMQTAALSLVRYASHMEHQCGWDARKRDQEKIKQKKIDKNRNVRNWLLGKSIIAKQWHV